MTHGTVQHAHAGDALTMTETEEAVLSRIREQARAHFSQARGSHDWDHTLRVHRLCRRIGAAEGADLLVTEAAAYLHDIGRSHQDRANGQLCHAEKGAAMAQEMLEAYSLTADRRENIIHCIAAHRFRRGDAPRTLEARVLFDADKLDAIGAVGVARAFLFAGELGARLHSPEVDVAKAPAYSIDDTGYREYVVKLTKIRDRILTVTGRRLADERHRFMAGFFDRFLEEYEGER
ncbi:MAG: HD domain-containing protein [Desulfosarcina sp.]|nr:HD domain-containing protein [Desulfosarcina sp.]MBC2742895.1 HD domain-containing protein [Desulfosarcina sp.]MBC2765805.1 HD domain-containing protein [Desulfosarcina sp.]